MLALFETLPSTQTIPHAELGQFPTPVEKLDELGDEVGVESLYVKRDDQSGTVYGGNKVRKLEFLLGQARAEGYDEVWTVGAIGSHHALATSIYARQLGLTPSVLHFPQPVTDHVLDNLRAISTTQPKLKLATHKVQLPVEVGKMKVKQWLSTAKDVYYIPGGGSSPVGVLGYVNAALELQQQIDAGELPEPDVIFVAAGTCGTLAGLMLGCRLAGMKTDVVGVRVVDKIMANATMTAHLANKAGKILTEHGVEDVPRISSSEVTMLDDYFGKDYGVPTDAGMEAIALAKAHGGLKLEPTYTGKAFAGLLGEREHLELANKNVLYWHTLSSADLSERIAQADVEHDLPSEYQKFFETSA
ncbi:pyridoxal-phosphate dependent enzyme [Persicimonas caeni]|uniref:Pyridoxal-phosphate dependent enzyme n=1 Tax=Persicimonas caeni TaxID=2292766 RepID=A0A4Y6Q261_PERCE|nr:pyridoxal-phosphate dependent enzyme [Persicimonas caeni]QDG54622.1 pyridoxal-phosphate dependent enzyme [Persicimonas caeni]QED35843.1 pyridoxal-phosphate dependent enzyme [Persicimonas caeni]